MPRAARASILLRCRAPPARGSLATAPALAGPQGLPCKLQDAAPRGRTPERLRDVSLIRGGKGQQSDLRLPIT